jgi:hypothetical protein
MATTSEAHQAIRNKPSNQQQPKVLLRAFIPISAPPFASPPPPQLRPQERPMRQPNPPPSPAFEHVTYHT